MKELIVAAVAVATITASTVNAETIPDSQSPWIYIEQFDAFSDQNTSLLRLESDLKSRIGDFEGTVFRGITSHARFKNGDHEKFEFVIGGCQG